MTSYKEVQQIIGCLLDLMEEDFHKQERQTFRELVIALIYLNSETTGLLTPNDIVTMRRQYKYLLAFKMLQIYCKKSG